MSDYVVSNKSVFNKEKETRNELKHRMRLAVVVLLIAVVVTSAVTFAWYIYNTNARTTKVHMAAGSSTALRISTDYANNYASSCDLSEGSAVLDPASTDNILNGFQKVYKFTEGGKGQASLLASIFGPVEAKDYFKKTVYLKTNTENLGVYVSDIGFTEKDNKNPISTALRVGLVVHEPGKNGKAASQYIFSLTDKRNPQAEYNTETGKEGYVLDSTRTDGTTVPFTPYSNKNFASYDEMTGKVTLKGDSVKLFDLAGTGTKEYGDPVKVDIYIWLEGCDSDCVNNLQGKTLSGIAVSFAGLAK